MRHNELTRDLINVVWVLSGMEASCKDVHVLRDDIGFAVKGKKNILGQIESVYYTLLLISIERNDMLKDILGAMHSWIVYLKKSYVDKPRRTSKKSHVITKEDANELADAINGWIIEISKKFSEPNTILLKEYDFNRFLSPKLRKGLGRKITSDLREGFELAGFNSPTATSMVLLRAAEGIVRNYYRKLTGKNTKKDWDKLLDDLVDNYKLPKSLSGYLHYLRKKRNEVMHPGKKFTQEESERILINVKNLLEEII